MHLLDGKVLFAFALWGAAVFVFVKESIRGWEGATTTPCSIRVAGGVCLAICIPLNRGLSVCPWDTVLRVRAHGATH